MQRVDIINTIGRQYLTSNTENGEYSYVQAAGGEYVLKTKLAERFPNQNFEGKLHKYLDIRFEDPSSGVVILIETKQQAACNRCRGSSWNTPEITSNLLSAMTDFTASQQTVGNKGPFTDEELTYLCKQKALGASNKDIAAQLGRKPADVSSKYSRLSVEDIEHYASL